MARPEQWDTWYASARRPFAAALWAPSTSWGARENAQVLQYPAASHSSTTYAAGWARVSRHGVRGHVSYGFDDLTAVALWGTAASADLGAGTG